MMAMTTVMNVCVFGVGDDVMTMVVISVVGVVVVVVGGDDVTCLWCVSD